MFYKKRFQASIKLLIQSHIFIVLITIKNIKTSVFAYHSAP